MELGEIGPEPQPPRSLTQEEWDLAISFADSIEAWMRGGVFER